MGTRDSERGEKDPALQEYRGQPRTRDHDRGSMATWVVETC